MRGHEVQAWIDANTFSGRYLIYDDCDFLPDQPLVLTNASTGITKNEIKKARDIVLAEFTF